ncbi:hypothetical protein F4818DRAFT_404143 [Hypoxylon cercidicola]|nr:hypothetical protein F4818DRAFT_404143 [Hypoxylon cercidicola]
MVGSGAQQLQGFFRSVTASFRRLLRRRPQSPEIKQTSDEFVYSAFSRSRLRYTNRLAFFSTAGYFFAPIFSSCQAVLKSLLLPRASTQFRPVALPPCPHRPRPSTQITKPDEPDMAEDQEHEGASVGERLIEACRRDNVELLDEIIADYEGKEEELANLLNNTTTVMGNHLYHEAALRGNYDIIDRLLDQDNFEIDRTNRADGDTPLHCAIRWINGEPPAQREFGNALVAMMLEAGSSTRVRNKAKLLPVQLVDPSNAPLRDLIQKHEYAELNAGDFVDADRAGKPAPSNKNPAAAAAFVDVPQHDEEEDDDDDAEFSGSDEEERAEWERRRKTKGR